MGQKQETEGLFAYDPLVGDLKYTHFFNEPTDDKWAQAALTIEGKVANLDLVYAGAYLKRDIHGQLDYSDYSYFYDTLFGYGAYITDDNGNLIAGAQYIQSKDFFTKESHEIRLTSPADNKLRFVAGLFYQKQTHNIQQRYKIDGLASSLEVPLWPDTLWLTKQLRTDKDYAAFGELAYDVTDKLTLTGGVRLFKAENGLKGFFGFGAGFSSGTGEAACFGPPIVDGAPCTNLNKVTKDDGYTYRLNATYHIDDDKMVYATVSTGYRPGGINRRGTLPPYSSDYLTNYEAGWKTTWAGGSVRWNGAVFHEQWKDFQFSFLGANGLTEIRNAGQAKMNGIESDLSWRPIQPLSITAAGSYVDAQLDEDYCADKLTNPSCSGSLEAPAGQQLPITSKFKANATARYDWDVGDFAAHVQGAWVYQSKSYADLRTVERGIIGALPSFSTFDFTAGVRKDSWFVEAYLKNAFDERGNVTRYAECATQVCGAQTYIVPVRPRTIGLRFGQNF
jgi:outer membrane receptor protein involved in Fe transport